MSLNKRIRMCKCKSEIELLDPESTDIFKRNMVDRYIDRPNKTFKKGRYRAVDNLCLANFFAYYYTDFVLPDTNDSQPVILDDDSVSNASNSLPRTLPLMSSKEKLKCRKDRQVLRYKNAPNKDLYPEEYAHHMLFLFYPFRNEDELLLDHSYCNKLALVNVIRLVNENKKIFEAYAEHIDAAFSLLNNNQSLQHVDNVRNVSTLEDDYQQPVLFNCAQTSRNLTSPPDLLSDVTLREMIRLLNCQQRQVFNIIYSWAKNKIKYSNSSLNHEVALLRLFVTGGAGVGKSYLMKTIFEALTKILNFHAGSPDKIKVLKIAPTGVAAINIDGTAINTALGIPLHQSLNINKLSDNLRSTLRNNYSNLAAIIVDEISMVSNARLYQIHCRLCEIFNVPLDVAFANLTILVVGDFYQLPPVRGEKQKSFYAF